MLVKIIIIGVVLAIVAGIWIITKDQPEDETTPTTKPVETVEEPVEVGYETSPVVEEKPKKARKPRAKKAKNA